MPKTKQSRSNSPATRDSAGFTLLELMVTVSIMAVVGVVLMLVMLSATRSKDTTTNSIESVQATRASLDLIARDLRSAGYGTDQGYGPLPQPAIAYVDSMQILINANLQPYPDTTSTRLPPQAYNPAAAPRPHPLDGTSWAPPIKYNTGAEVIRWTLDLNNDGVVDASDIADANGVDAQSTPNPDDYMLSRQVYGDSTAGVPTFNGGAHERIALVRRPGNGVPPIFTVWMRDSSVAWNWASGPVPANRLEDIERIVVEMVASSPRPDWRGEFAEATMRTEINAMRNTPRDLEEWAVNGFVWDDKDYDLFMDGGEDKLEGSRVELGGSLSAITDINGFFQILAPNGTYTLRHDPPKGYGVFMNPDSFVVTIADAPVTRSFADTARAGGWVTAEVFFDTDKDGDWDGDEFPAEDVSAFLVADSSYKVSTDEFGYAKLFAQEGNYGLSIVPPDSFVTSVAIPIINSINDGDTKSHEIGIHLSKFGIIEGTVYEDDDLDGVFDVGEKGVGNVWVGAALEGGPTVAWVSTDGDGNYSLEVPINDPPATLAYIVSIQPPPGSPSTVAPIDSIFVQDGQVLTDNDFGLGGFLIITADADRVLSLGSGDLYENDWSTGTPRRDRDIVLGAEASGEENIMVWFNRYDDNKLFKGDPTYVRDAPHSVLSIALDSLDKKKPERRLDLITGTRYTAQGNFFVWLTQNTSGNEGYIPDGYSPGLNYKTTDNGDVITILTANLVGSQAPDIIVGTRGVVSGQGSVELWENKQLGNTIDLTHVQTISGIGEANGMALADFDQDGKIELVIGTRTADWTGELLFYEQPSPGLGFVYAQSYSLSGDFIQGLAVLDVDADGWLDIVTGTQSSISTGKLQWWRNDKTGATDFSLHDEVAAPGLVMSLIAEDISGIGAKDLVVGWRENNNSFKGGVRLYYTSTGSLPSTNVDPSAGKVKNYVTGITSGNFNYGVFPATPFPPYLTDFAVGVKKDAKKGELVIFIR